VRESITIGGVEIAPGKRKSIQLPVPGGYTSGQISVPVHVVRGRRDGPSLMVCAAVHGDEINGVEIVRRLLALRRLKSLRGTLIAVPVVNVHGFLTRSRYLPDRRDLNRSFPGSAKGSQAGRLAHVVMTQLAVHATHAVDLHTGAIHRENLPQIRGCLDDPGTVDMARAFGVPVVLHSELRDGSLREALRERGIPAVVYEAGEALRFDEVAIRAGLRGVVAVMRSLGMFSSAARPTPARQPLLARGSHWLRAPESGILSTTVKLGDVVEKGALVGIVTDPLGEMSERIEAHDSGVVIGCTNLPLVNEGDAIFHVALFRQPEAVADRVGAFQAAMDTATPLVEVDPAAD
jgi:hypothetical protein